jgi:hypothetical protein
MASAAYMAGRKKYSRPQAMLWAENAGTLDNGFYVPAGLEVGSQTDGIQTENQFIVLSDDNRAEINFAPTRIERRERMINGRMRSYHIADKLNISTSWNFLPSRSYYTLPDFDPTTGRSAYAGNNSQEFTTDGGAGGVELLDWYNNHSGSFWVYLSYDNYKAFGDDAAAYGNLAKYSQIVEVFFADFQYSVVKRGGSNYDFWNISVTLEEV